MAVRLEEHFREQLASMKTEHLRELDHMRASHALEHSSSKVTELTNKLSTHQVRAGNQAEVSCSSTWADQVFYFEILFIDGHETFTSSAEGTSGD